MELVRSTLNLLQHISPALLAAIAGLMVLVAGYYFWSTVKLHREVEDYHLKALESKLQIIREQLATDRVLQRGHLEALNRELEALKAQDEIRFRYLAALKAQDEIRSRNSSTEFAARILEYIGNIDLQDKKTVSKARREAAAE